VQSVGSGVEGKQLLLGGRFVGVAAEGLERRRAQAGRLSGKDGKQGGPEFRTGSMRRR